MIFPVRKITGSLTYIKRSPISRADDYERVKVFTGVSVRFIVTSITKRHWQGAPYGIHQ